MPCENSVSESPRQCKPLPKATKRRYIIFAPAYSGSNGTRARYKLHDLLRERGYEAFLWCNEEPHRECYHYVDAITPGMRDNDVAVYADAPAGNPLGLKRVARWVLYFPGYFGGTKVYHPSEAIFTWNRLYFDAPELRVPAFDHDLFFDPGKPKTIDCYFVHKGGKWKNVKEVDGLLELNMQFPATRRELAKILQTTGTLYSFDPHTAVLWEAKLCGVRHVLVVTEDGFAEYNGIPAAEDPHEVVERQLSYFIETTQAMPATEEIEKISLGLCLKNAFWDKVKLLGRVTRKVFGDSVYMYATDLVHHYRRWRYSRSSDDVLGGKL